MSNVEDIATAIENLSPEDLVRFRAWFETFDAEAFDRKVEADALSGKLDQFAREALEQYRFGQPREL